MSFKMWKPNKIILTSSIIGTTAGLGFLLKAYTGGKMYEGRERLEGKTVIITGANTGIGKETARELAKRGAKIVMACRDMEKCEETRKNIVIESGNEYVYCQLLDLASLESVKEFVSRFKKEHTRLDILINNAGVMRCPKSLTKNGFETQLGVNHLGHFLLTNLLLDYLKSSAPSRIINVSSLAHKSGSINMEDLNSDRDYNTGLAYNQSKLANILFTNVLSKRLEGTGVTVNSLHPGVVDTEIIRHLGFLNNWFIKFFCKPVIFLLFKTPKQGAQTTIYAALDPILEKVSGKYFSDLGESKVAPQAKDEKMGIWLWKVSEKWTRLKDVIVDYT